MSSRRVVVTGGSGYIAVHLIKQLLEKGYKVHATVRSLTNEQKLAPLRSLPNAKENLILFEANLLEEGSFDQAITGCSAVFHTASPFFYDSANPEKDLLEPALKGTLNVLRSVEKLEAISDVILTSSVVAIYEQPWKNGYTYTEADWNYTSTLQDAPYFVSKRMAEQAAWDFVNNSKRKFRLVVINPGFVIGPLPNNWKSNVGTSLDALRSFMLAGRDKASPLFGPAFVDVRDAAKAHILALENPQASGRYCCVIRGASFREICDILAKFYPQYEIPRNSTGFGWPVIVDNSKIKKDLGIEFIPLEQSLKETIESLLNQNQLERK